MSSPTVPYVLGGTQTEQQRLIAQAEALEGSARWMLDRINLKPGLRAVDVGCVPIGIMNLLSERVGADGIVIGVEREPRFLDMARAEQSRRGLSNVKLVNADALNIGLDKNSYDFVHERLVLINIPVAVLQAVLKEMLSLLKPGGMIAIQEFDFVSFACDPDHPSWNVLFNTWCDAFHAASGSTQFIGRSLARLLRSAGAENVRIHAHANLPQVGEYQRTHILSLIESAPDLMVGSGKLTAAELRDHIAALAKHLADPKTTLIDRLVVQAWGNKPV
jgi:ubiquinone/menaquinone biosynthesis C-methylase UbiE